MCVFSVTCAPGTTIDDPSCLRNDCQTGSVTFAGHCCCLGLVSGLDHPATGLGLTTKGFVSGRPSDIAVSDKAVRSFLGSRTAAIRATNNMVDCSCMD